MSEKVVRLDDRRGSGETSAEFRVCVECVHHRFREPDHPHGAEATGNNRCTATTHERGINPVTGQDQYFIVNDLGKRVPTRDEHPDCYDMNPDGKCPNFVSIATLGK